MRFCNRCGCITSPENFYSSSTSKDGYSQICKECTKLKSQEYHQTARGVFSELKKRCKRQLIPVHITAGEFAMWYADSDRCYFCQTDTKDYNLIRDFIKSYEGTDRRILKLKSLFDNPKHDTDRLSVTRLDYESPYHQSNIVKKCWLCSNIHLIMKPSHLFEMAPEVIRDLKRDINESSEVPLWKVGNHGK
jgi:hypothetical protein